MCRSRITNQYQRAPTSVHCIEGLVFLAHLVFYALQYTISIGLIPDVVPFDTFHHVAPDVSFAGMILGNSSVFGGGYKIYRGAVINLPGISVHVSGNIKIITISHVGFHPIGSATFM